MGLSHNLHPAIPPVEPLTKYLAYNLCGFPTTLTDKCLRTFQVTLTLCVLLSPFGRPLLRHVPGVYQDLYPPCPQAPSTI